MSALSCLSALLLVLGIGVVDSHAQSLREQADARGVSIGAAVRPSLFSEKLYAATLGREFNMIEAEDAMKWWVIRPDRASFDFTQGDQVVVFAETHGMRVRGPTLVWGWTNPDWLTKGQFTPAQLRQLLEEHIATVAGHYRGKVFAWERDQRSVRRTRKIEAFDLVRPAGNQNGGSIDCLH